MRTWQPPISQERTFGPPEATLAALRGAGGCWIILPSLLPSAPLPVPPSLRAAMSAAWGPRPALRGAAWHLVLVPSQRLDLAFT